MVKLAEAIEIMQDCGPDKLSHDEITALALVIAAARAFACQTCGGSGLVWKDKFNCQAECVDCRDDRLKASQ